MFLVGQKFIFFQKGSEIGFQILKYCFSIFGKEFI